VLTALLPSGWEMKFSPEQIKPTGLRLEGSDSCGQPGMDIPFYRLPRQRHVGSSTCICGQRRRASYPENATGAIGQAGSLRNRVFYQRASFEAATPVKRIGTGEGDTVHARAVNLARWWIAKKVGYLSAYFRSKRRTPPPPGDAGH